MTDEINDPNKQSDIDINGPLQSGITGIGSEMHFHGDVNLTIGGAAQVAPTPKVTDGPPRVFISYARSDGETFANGLREHLQAANIPLWQDRVGMEGGRDWWRQIAEAIESSEFMALVMTPAAMKSPVVRKEWRHARQQGVCVYPLKAGSRADFDSLIGSLPRWMRDSHFYDLGFDPDHLDQGPEWDKFLLDLKQRCTIQRVPFMAQDLPKDYVMRPDQFNALIGKLLDEKREEPVASTAALRGAGGYGKTTQANAICHDEQVQQAFDDGILWITLGEKPDNLIGKVDDLVYVLSGKRSGASSLETVTAELVRLLEDRDILIVIDDVWDRAHLKPFLQGGKRCARLITTRNRDTLPDDAQKIDVDAMRQTEAVKLLGWGLPDEEPQDMAKLAKRMGEWALMLKLANGVLREQINMGKTLRLALDYVNKALDRRGLTAFDARSDSDRGKAARKTIAVSLELLSADERECYTSLTIFPEDINIPLATLEKLWNLDDFDSETLCNRLFNLSLLLNLDLNTRYIRLHDVIRSYLTGEAQSVLPSLHGKLLDAYHIARWADLSPDEPYLWDWLAYHLIEAGHGDELIATVKDLRYLTAKRHARNAYAAESDLAMAESWADKKHPDRALSLLRRNFGNMTHLLNRCETPNDTAATLCHRLQHLPELADACHTLESELKPPRIDLWRPLPDLPHPALIRTLSGHTNDVNGCAFSPDGGWIVSASKDKTLKIWNATTGAERLTLEGHSGEVLDCAFSPDGRWIASASWDATLKIWDVVSGSEQLTLHGHTGGVFRCSFSPDGRWIASASKDKTLKIWDAVTGSEHLTLTLPGVNGDVNGCAFSPDGRWIASVWDDGTLIIWDVANGVEQFRFKHIRKLRRCVFGSDSRTIFFLSVGKLRSLDLYTNLVADTPWAASEIAVSRDGRRIALVSPTGTLKICDMATGQEVMNLWAHMKYMNACVFSSDGNRLITASSDRSLKIWDITVDQNNPEMQSVQDGYQGRIRGCAISEVGKFILSGSADKTLITWDLDTGSKKLTLPQKRGVRGCAVSLQGDFVVSGSVSSTGTLDVWDLVTGTEKYSLHGHNYGVNACAISASGDFIVSAGGGYSLLGKQDLENTLLKIWDAATGTARRTLIGHASYLHACAISPADDFIVSASEDRTLKIWDVATGQEIRTLTGHTAAVRGCAISPDRRWIVSVSLDRTLRLWDVATGKGIRTLTEHRAAVLACAISKAGDFIVSAASDGTVYVWDAASGQCFAKFFADGVLYTCAVHPDGEHLIAGGDRGLYWLRLRR